VLVVVAQVVVDPGHVEAELADVLGFEPADLQFDDDEAGLDPVEEQQVDEIPRSEFCRLFRFPGYADLRVGPALTTCFRSGCRNSSLKPLTISGR
jgi:hypothetical protein